MTEIAGVILAHNDPRHVRRLVGSLDGVPLVLHCDAKTPRAVFEQMVRGLPERVTVCERRRTSLGSWSLVDAELTALRVAVRRTRARHIAVLSGSDYPLTSVDALVDELRSWEDRSYFRNVPMPFPGWSHHRRSDGGLWRLEHRFLTWRGQLLYLRGAPLRSPTRRRVPPELSLRAASQWKIYARCHVELLLRLTDSRPDLIRFWRSTYIPDETFAASMLGSRALLGSDAMPPCGAHPWYIRWDDPGDHPAWLTSRDFDDLARARWAAPPPPEVINNAEPTEPPAHRRLFARKFASAVDPSLPDRIDRELRQ